MPNYIPNPRWGTGTAFDPEIKRLFGLDPKQKWPAEGMPAREIQGVTVWVEPIPQLIPGRRRRFALRARGKCPTCGKVTALSRLYQHSKVHPE